MLERLLVPCFSLLIACGGPEDGPSGSASSAGGAAGTSGAATTAATTTTTSTSTSTSTTATGAGGSALPGPGFGTLAGDCDELDASDLMSMAPGVMLQNTLTFPAMPYMYADLSMGGQTLFDDPNAGGSSKESEIFAFEVLHRCELATLVKTETEIEYDATGPIKIEPQEKPVFVCACGLSKKFPLCDGSHKACKDETPGKVSVYDKERREVVEERED